MFIFKRPFFSPYRIFTFFSLLFRQPDHAELIAYSPSIFLALKTVQNFFFLMFRPNLRGNLMSGVGEGRGSDYLVFVTLCGRGL